MALLMVRSGAGMRMSSGWGLLLLVVVSGSGQALAQVGSADTESPPADSGSAEPTVKAAELEKVQVIGFRRRYLETETETGLGMPVDALDLPLSAIALPADLLKDQQVNNVEDALRNVAGVTRFKQGNGGEEKFSIRGIDVSQNLYIDGARINNQFNATNIATTETANIDRYEVLKGPASILYGQGFAGGVINYLTKKPSFAPYAEFELIGGSDDYWRIEGDVTGPLLAQLAGRGIVSWEDSQSYRDEIARNRWLVNPSLSWQPGSATHLRVSVSYIEDDYTQDRGQVLLAQPDGSFAYPDFIDASVFLGVPGWNEQTHSEYLRPAFNLSHQISGDWSLELLGALTEVDKQLFDSSPGTASADGTVSISPSFQAGEGETRYLRLNNRFGFDTPGGMRHQTLVSLSYETQGNDGYSLGATSSVIYDANTGTYSGLDFLLDPARFELITDTREWTLAAQDLISIADRWVVLVGAGFTDYEDRESGTSEQAINPRLGLIWKDTPARSWYASYATGFVPNSDSFDASGGPLDPQTTVQWEAGVKQDLADGRLALSAAVFDITQDDQAITDPAAVDLPPAEQYSATLGETSTQGFDAQLIGEASATIRLIGSYAYLSTATDNDSFGSTTASGDSELPGIPRHSGSLWAVVEAHEGPARGLGLGAGVFAQSEVYIGLENVSRYSGWSQVDLAAFYKRGRAKLQINLRNAFDEEYLLTQALASESLASRRVGTATPRSLTASLAWELGR